MPRGSCPRWISCMRCPRGLRRRWPGTACYRSGWTRSSRSLSKMRRLGCRLRMIVALARFRAGGLRGFLRSGSAIVWMVVWARAPNWMSEGWGYWMLGFMSSSKCSFLFIAGLFHEFVPDSSISNGRGAVGQSSILRIPC